MKKTKLPALLLGALFALLILASCNNDFGIMQSIQEEEKQAKDSVFYKTTVGGMAELGSNYYVQMNGIWTRPAAAGSSWSSLSGGGLPSSYSCAGLVEAGGSLYAALLGAGVYSSADGTSWTKLSDPSFAGKNIDAIWEANNVLFLQDHGAGADTSSTETADDIYTLNYLNAGVLTGTGVPAQTGKPFKGAAYDGSNYWAIAGSTLFSGALGSMAAAAETGMPSGVTLSSILASASDLYVGRVDGSVYRRTGANTWNSATVLADAEVTALFEISSPSTRLLVGLGGTEGEGYYELAPDLSAKLSGGASGALLSDSTVYSTTLSNKPVNAFFLDDLGAGSFRLFACATSGGLAGSGLYANEFNGSSWGGWASE